MKHFLMTRFNLRNESWKTAKDGTLVLTEEWLNHRFSLFQQYCLPSVKNQINQNFIWLVFFDCATPDSFKIKIEEISKYYKPFHAIYIDGMNELLPSSRNYISTFIDESDKFIITSRLDNDDLIHQNFIGTIQQLARPSSDLIIDLRKGYQINKGKKNPEIRKVYNYFNPFVSIVESTADFKTILSRMHREWKHSTFVFSEDKKPLWIELIHEKNKLSIVRKNLLLTRNIRFREFGLIEVIKKPGLSFVVRTNTLILLKRFYAKCIKALQRFLFEGTSD